MREAAAEILAEQKMRRQVSQSPALRRGLRRWRRTAAALRALHSQDELWRIAAAALAETRARDMLHGALGRLMTWCRARRASTDALDAASGQLSRLRARRAARRWREQAQLATAAAEQLSRGARRATHSRASTGWLALVKAASRGRRADAAAAAALASVRRAGGVRLLRGLCALQKRRGAATRARATLLRLHSSHALSLWARRGSTG